jgi:hypothetical protein
VLISMKVRDEVEQAAAAWWRRHNCGRRPVGSRRDWLAGRADLIIEVTVISTMQFFV